MSWFYFGCDHGPGHYLMHANRARVSNAGWRRLTRFDAMLAPQMRSQDSVLYQAVVSRLGGYRLFALSWWDRSVDSRPGSNSIIFGPNVDYPAEQLLRDAEERFPWVFARLPQPVVLYGAEDTRPAPPT